MVQCSVSSAENSATMGALVRRSVGRSALNSGQRCADARQFVRGFVDEGVQTCGGSCVGLWAKVRRCGGKRVVGCGGFAWQKQINLLVVAIFVAET